MRLGDLDRARELLDEAERGLHGDTVFPGDHVRTLIGDEALGIQVAYFIDPDGTNLEITRPKGGFSN
ncbi:hypothetical protein [Streptosporangium sp. NPDC051022]|uniref:VOC family protein n=1 Tax=Streptosporangium sp. NPDC051022 TaxID=3155752 RepID=UPI003435319B